MNNNIKAYLVVAEKNEENIGYRVHNYKSLPAT
jgi:hypothetical protein